MPPPGFMSCRYGDVAVGAMDGIGREIVAPIRALADGLPLLLCARKGDILQAEASVESPRGDGLEGSGQGDGLQVVAVVERILANGGHVAADGQARQLQAVVEGLGADRGHA